MKNGALEVRTWDSVVVAAGVGYSERTTTARTCACTRRWGQERGSPRHSASSGTDTTECSRTQEGSQLTTQVKY